MKFKNLFFSLLLFINCKPAQHSETLERNKNPNAKYTSCQLIEKEFVNKGGKMTEYKELYLSCSIQDYFIKICEGNVTAQELKKYINKVITVDMEIKDGMWDICSDDPAYAQSRTGTYVVIKKIVD